jgi:hypothetical protein
VSIDDDMQGASHGNGNGIVEFDETIELSLTIRNIGLIDAFDVSALPTTTSRFVGLPADPVAFGDILSGTSVTNTEPVLFHVRRDVPDGELLAFDFALSEEPGAMPMELTAYAPIYLVGISEIDDSGGNNNGIPDPGETVTLTMALSNEGSSDSPDLVAYLGTASGYFIPDETPVGLGVLEAGQAAMLGGFTVEVAPDCPPIYTHYLRLVLEGPNHYVAPLQFPFSVGEIFADDMEIATASWSHEPCQTGWLDEWHLETYRNHTPGGETSWKCGGAGAAPYANLLYAGLQTAEFELPPGSQLTFWHWIHAETSAAYAGYCYDGGLLEISPDGGWDWFPLTPEGGYPYLIRDGSIPGPFLAETPVWSGQQGWTLETVDLSAWTGPIILRWAFGTDGADVVEGWYIDDVRVFTVPPADVDGNDAAWELHPRLYPTSPNPVALGGAGMAGTSHVTIRFALPEAEEGQLMLLDAGGRLVRLLAAGSFASGEHRLSWDGRDNAGQFVGAGSYYLQLVWEGSREARKLTVLR